MKEYYAIPLEDEEAQALFDNYRLMDDEHVLLSYLYFTIIGKGEILVR